MDSSGVRIEDIPVEQIAETTQERKPPSLVDTEITNENTALNVIISFLNLAQNRGVFNLKESAKIWECVQLFIKE
jgi:hypothetical protein